MGKWYERRKKAKQEAAKVYPADYMHTPYWCEGHWAPYRVANPEGVYPNGMMASTMLAQAFLTSPEYVELPDKSPRAVDKHMKAAERPLCCRLGDETMNRVLEQATKYGTNKGPYEPRQA